MTGSELDDIMDERDRLADALAETHRALGGDGEWCAKPGATCAAGETGDLAIDCPALATTLRERVEALEAALEKVPQAVYDEIVEECGRTMATAAAHAAKTVYRAARGEGVGGEH